MGRFVENNKAVRTRVNQYICIFIVKTKHAIRFNFIYGNGT